MFYFIITIVLLIVAVLYKISQRLEAGKGCFSKLSLLFYCIVVFFTFHSAEAIGLKVPPSSSIKLKLPKRLLSPQSWYQFSSAKSHNFPDRSFPSSRNIYDKQLFVFKSSRFLCSFSLDSKVNLHTIFQKCYEPVGGNKFDFDDNFCISYKSKEGKLFPKKGLFPFTHYRYDSYRFLLDFKKLKSLVDDFQFMPFHKAFKSLGKEQFPPASDDCFFCLIPCSKSETFVDLPYEKALSILYPAQKYEYRNLWYNLEVSHEDLKSMPILAYLPILATSFKLSFSLIALLVVVGFFICRRATVSIILSAVVIVCYHKYYDVKNADNGNCILSNRYAIPMVRDYLKKRLNDTPPMAFDYDGVRLYYNMLFANKRALNYQFNVEVNDPFFKITFLNKDEFIEVFLPEAHARIKFSQYHTRHEIPRVTLNLVVDKVKRLLKEGETSKAFILDARTFRVKPIKNQVQVGDSFDEHLKKEFIHFFDLITDEEKIGDHNEK